MAYDTDLAERVRAALAPRARNDEIAMFGGLCWTVRGNMVVGVVRDELMARVGPDQHEEALARPGARPMDFTKRPMKGFLFVGGDGIKTARALQWWIDRSLAFNATLPEKKKAPKKPATRATTSGRVAKPAARSRPRKRAR